MATQLKPDDIPADLPPNDNGEQDGGETAPPERDIEAEAKEHGWSPKEEFKGDASRWVDAETFMKRADEVMPLLKSQNQRLKRDLDEMKKTLKRFSKHASSAEERIRAEVQAEMEAAVESGDVEGFRAAQKRAGTLTGEEPPQHTAEEAEEAFEEFRDANPWYDRANLASATDLEKDARAYADRMTQRHIAKTKEMAPAAFFAFIAEKVEERYPQVKGKAAPRVKPSSDVAPTTPPRGPRNGRTWEALPAEARSKFDKWIGQGLGDKAYYLKTFDWDGYQKAG